MKKYTKYILLFLIPVFAGWFFIRYIDRAEKFSDFTTFSTSDKVDDKKEEVETTDDAPADGLVLIGNVSFTSQAPFGNWDDPRQQDGCEEAASLMAVYWARGQSLSLQEAERQIISASDWQLENYGEFRDSSVQDTLDRIIKGYLGYQRAEARYDITSEDIIKELMKGNLVIAPTNGQLLGNPYFTPPGPERHMFVIKGFDFKTNEFIVNDNGTRRGENFRYSENVLMNAIMDYPTGYKVPITQIRKAMIVVRPI